MALFETMRENTKVILWITVLAFVGLIFLAWGADFATRVRGGRGEPGVLGRVNGEPIYEQQYSQLTEQARAAYQGETGQAADDATLVLLAANTWDRMVDGILMRQMAEHNGISVTDQEIANAILYAPLQRFRSMETFQNSSGQFDLQRYQAWVTDPQTNTLPLEQEYREMLMMQKLRLLAFSTVKVSGEEVHNAWKERNLKADIAYVQVPYRVGRDEQADNETLQAYLDAHPDDFRVPAQAVLEYVRVEKTPTPEDSLEARTQMDEVRRSLDRGEEFLPLVQSYSDAPQNRWGGENGAYLTREQLTPEALREPAFTLPVGATSNVIEAEDGLHLLRIEDRKTEDGVEKVKIADIFIPIQMSYDSNYALREKMLDLVDSTGVSIFSEAAEAADLPVQTTRPFDPESGYVPGMPRLEAAKDFVRTAQVGKTSRPIEAADAWYVLHMAERRPASVPPLEEIRRGVRVAYFGEQSKESATQEAQTILDHVRAGMNLEAAAKTDSMAVYSRAEGVTPLGSVRGLGFDPHLNATVFATQETGLIPQVVVGNRATFVVEVLSPPAEDEAAFAAAKDQLRQQLLQQRQSQAATDWLDQVRREARIEDYRPVIASM